MRIKAIKIPMEAAAMMQSAIVLTRAFFASLRPIASIVYCDSM